MKKIHHLYFFGTHAFFTLPSIEFSLANRPKLKPGVPRVVDYLHHLRKAELLPAGNVERTHLELLKSQ